MAAIGRRAMILTIAPSASATPAAVWRRWRTRNTAPSTARPTSASLWPPLTKLTIVTGFTPSTASAIGSADRRSIRTIAATTARAERTWKKRRAAPRESPATAIPPADTTVKRGP
jgi:hypothetical protein